MTAATKIISHSTDSTNLQTQLQTIRQRIEENGDLAYASVAQQLIMLDELSQFDFGRFLIQHQGVNGYWTHYMLTHPWYGRKTGINNADEPFSPMETFLLDKLPWMLATQQRFEIFLRENQKAVKDHAVLACIPSEMLGELLYLDFSNIKQIDLVGIDLDRETLLQAEQLAHQRQLSSLLDLRLQDAWQLTSENEFDLISSNGLTIYEANDERIISLYQKFYDALKAGGRLVTSFATPPPTLTDQCEWQMDKINQHDLLQQKIIIADIVNFNFQCYRSTEQTRTQLQQAGFQNIEFNYDEAHIFPTVVAIK